jgi:DNA-binding MarR family transcriptional regulator
VENPPLVKGEAAPVAPPDPLLRMPGYLAGELVTLIRRMTTEFFPGERLRRAHIAVLTCIAEQGSLCQREISEILRFDPGDVVGLIDTLEERDYVVRGRDPRDRRRYALEITPAGRQALQRHRDRSTRLHETLFAPLAPDEVDQLRVLLLRVLAHHDPRFVDEARRMGEHGTRTGGGTDQPLPD